jgi:hypothetical protein
VTTPTLNRPRSRDNRSVSAMVGAMIAVLGLVAVLGGLKWLQHGDVPNPARTVSYTASLAEARAQAPFTVLAPEPVPAGLRATSVSWDPVGPHKVWHLGFLTAGNDYLGLYQGTGAVDAFVEAATPATKPGPPVTVAGDAWGSLTSSDGHETALVHTSSGVTTVVTGTVDRAALIAFAASLRG